MPCMGQRVCGFRHFRQPHARYRLLVVLAADSRGDVANLLQCRFYLHEVVDVELDGVAVPFPHLTGNEDSLVQRPLGLFQSGLQIVRGVLRVLHGHTYGSIFCRDFLFVSHVTIPFRPEREGRFSGIYRINAPRRQIRKRQAKTV